MFYSFGSNFKNVLKEKDPEGIWSNTVREK